MHFRVSQLSATGQCSEEVQRAGAVQCIVHSVWCSVHCLTARSTVHSAVQQGIEEVQLAGAVQCIPADPDAARAQAANTNAKHHHHC